MAPTFFKPADGAALCDWFAQMLRALRSAVLFLRHPGNDRRDNQHREFVQRAAEQIPGLVGVKYTNPDREQLRAMLNTNGQPRTCCLVR
ncbi:MAG: hypothetical protein Ct9H300mP7_5810 [Verrucomicrobiota bacterium]|nr:MAG: hypothetical protein Ct9H300mP7_5810 [Verrucomicrobiota bacterium]